MQVPVTLFLMLERVREGKGREGASLSQCYLLSVYRVWNRDRLDCRMVLVRSHLLPISFGYQFPKTQSRPCSDP